MARGLKIYFDGEKFVRDEFYSEVQAVWGDTTTHWNAAPHTADAAVDDLNEHMRFNVQDVKKRADFLVQTCVECGEYFVIDFDGIEWFRDRGLKIPRRCVGCRQKRKANKLPETKVD